MWQITWPPSDPVSFWGSVASIVVGIPTLLYWAYLVWVALRRQYNSRTLRPGIYKGFWIDPVNIEVNCEVLRLRRWFGGFRARPVYIHKNKHDYILKAIPLPKSGDIFIGEWASKRSALYRGAAMFHFNERQFDLDGRWIGPRRDHSINCGEWYLFRYAAAGNNQYLRRPLKMQLERIIARFWREQSIVADIITKHLAHGAQPITVEGIRLDIEDSCFGPALGKVSIPLVQHAATLIKRDDRVLDLGTGSGFYTIYLAHTLGVRAVGIDLTPELVNLARSNASQNGVAQLTEFRTCAADDLFSELKEKEKFDLIIANLPFSRRRKTVKSCASPLHSSFAGSPRLVEQLILGSQFHARPGARLVFCYGRSGYWEYLHDLIEVSAWKIVRKIEASRSKDDVFYLFELTVSDYVEQAYKRLVTNTGTQQATASD